MRRRSFLVALTALAVGLGNVACVGGARAARPAGTESTVLDVVSNREGYGIVGSPVVALLPRDSPPGRSRSRAPAPRRPPSSAGGRAAVPSARRLFRPIERLR